MAGSGCEAELTKWESQSPILRSTSRVTRHWTGLACAVGTKLHYFVVDACGREYMGFTVGRKDDGIKGW